MADLLDLQYELDGSFLFGRGTAVTVQLFDPGTPDQRNVRRDRPRADGIAYGRDRRGGRLLTWTGNILTPEGAGALDLCSAMTKAWDAETIRTTPGGVSVMRMVRGNRARRVYGRAERFKAQTDRSEAGWIPYQCDFMASDHRFYGDADYSIIVPLVAPAGGGFTFPVLFPWSTLGFAYSPGDITITGELGGWPVFTIYGPIASPAVNLVGGYQIGLNLTLLTGQWARIDTRPWSRGVTSDSGANLAGAITVGSPRLSRCALPAGSQEVALIGQDLTGTSYLSLSVTDIYSSF